MIKNVIRCKVIFILFMALGCNGGKEIYPVERVPFSIAEVSEFITFDQKKSWIQSISVESRSTFLYKSTATIRLNVTTDSECSNDITVISPESKSEDVVTISCDELKMRVREYLKRGIFRKLSRTGVTIYTVDITPNSANLDSIQPSPSLEIKRTKLIQDGRDAELLLHFAFFNNPGTKAAFVKDLEKNNFAYDLSNSLIVYFQLTENYSHLKQELNNYVN